MSPPPPSCESVTQMKGEGLVGVGWEAEHYGKEEEVLSHAHSSEKMTRYHQAKEKVISRKKTRNICRASSCQLEAGDAGQSWYRVTGKQESHRQAQTEKTGEPQTGTDRESGKAIGRLTNGKQQSHRQAQIQKAGKPQTATTWKAGEPQTSRQEV